MQNERHSPDTVHVLAHFRSICSLELAQLCVPLDLEEHLLSCLGCHLMFHRIKQDISLKDETCRRCTNLDLDIDRRISVLCLGLYVVRRYWLLSVRHCEVLVGMVVHVM